MVCSSFSLKFSSVAAMSPCRRCSKSEANWLLQTGASAAVCYVKARVECQCCECADAEPC